MLQRQVNYTFLLFVLLLSGFYLKAKGQDMPFMQQKIEKLAALADTGIWPMSDADSTFVIAVVQSGEYFEAIAKFYKGKKFKRRPVQVVFYEDIEANFDCNLLFVPENIPEHFSTIDTIREKSILVISGGAKTFAFHIRFFILNGKLTFDVDREVCKEAALDLDYQFKKTSRIFKR